MSTYNTFKDNLIAVTPRLENERKMREKRQLCWQCQKDKSIKNGLVRIASGLYKFVCADCMASAKEKKEQRT